MQLKNLSRLIIVALTTLIFLFGCGKDNKTSSQVNNPTTTSQNEQSKKSIDQLIAKYPSESVLIYLHEDPITDEYCDRAKRLTGWKNSICINDKNDWKILCEEASFAIGEALEKPARVAASNGSSANSQNALISVTRNKGAEFDSSKWIADQKYGKCQYSIQYTGLYEGSNVNEKLSFEAWAMGIMKDGSVVITD